MPGDMPTPEQIAERQMAICEEMQVLYPERKWPGPSALDFDDAFCYSDKVLGEVENPLPDHAGMEVLQERLKTVHALARQHPAFG